MQLSNSVCGAPIEFGESVGKFKIGVGKKSSKYPHEITLEGGFVSHNMHDVLYKWKQKEFQPLFNQTTTGSVASNVGVERNMIESASELNNFVSVMEVKEVISNAKQ